MAFAPSRGPSTADEPGLRDYVRSERARRRAEHEDAGRTMREWALEVPERGQRLNFEDFSFQEEWYGKEVDYAREVVWMKAAQVGMSGYAWRWAARRAEQFGDRVIYFFPTDDDVSDFGDQRIEPSIEESDLLQRRIPAHYVRNKHLKRIGAGDLSLRGTRSRTAVQSVDADALIFDERDYHDQANLAQAERRLAGAEAAGRFPRKRWLGYPTLPGTGIHALFAKSQQRTWRVTCPECSSEQELVWERNIRWTSKAGGEEALGPETDAYDAVEDVTAAWRVCRDCSASLEGDPIRHGRWVPRFPDRELIGYQVSRLIVLRTDLVELVKNSRKTAPHEIEAFYNNDLGLPWIPAEAALTEEDVYAACAHGGPQLTVYRNRFPIVAGVDVASERALSMWIDELSHDGRQRAIWIGEPRDFQEVAELIKRFTPNLTVIDSMPERRQARAVAATFPGSVILASYDEKDNADAFKYDPKKNLVTVQRTEAIDAFMDGIRQLRRIPLRQPPPRFVSQLTSPKRTTELSPRGIPRRVYVSTGPDGDDYAHAGVYALVAKELYVLQAQVQETLAAAAGTAIADERLGFRDDAYSSPSRW